MALSLATVGAKISATFINLIVGRVNRQGLTSIIPTSVAGTGVTVGANGLVTFTATTAVNINGCFTAEFENYQVVLNLPSIGTGGNLQLRLRAAGVDLSTATYAHGGTSNNTSSAVSSAGTYTGFYLTGNPASAISASGVVNLFSPFLASVKRMTSVFGTLGSYVTGDTCGGSQPSTASYDGFTLLNDAVANMTGTARIYGYNNN